MSRLTATFRDRHWSSFLLELSLIVLGILIALTIDAWMHDRADRKAELLYLEMLSSDLDQINQSLQIFLDFETDNASTGAAALRMLANDEYRSRPDELRSKLWKMSWRKTMNLESAAYTDLISTGNLRLIRNRPLRNQLLLYFAEVGRVESVADKNNAVFVDQMYNPYLMEMGIAWSPEDSGPIHTQIKGGTLDFLRLVEPELAVIEDDLFSEPLDEDTLSSLQRMVVLRTRSASIGRGMARSMMEKTAELKASVDEEIAAR